MTVGEQIAQRIEELIAERGMSYRRVQLALCELRPGSTEAGWRKQLRRWRLGQVPEPEQAQLLGQVLDVDPSEFRPAEITAARAALLQMRVNALEELRSELESFRPVEDDAQIAELREQLSRLQAIADGEGRRVRRRAIAQ